MLEAVVLKIVNAGNPVFFLVSLLESHTNVDYYLKYELVPFVHSLEQGI